MMLLRPLALAAQPGLRSRPGDLATLALCAACAALAGALTAHAGTASLKISQYQKQDWQVENGLPSGNVRAIAQTQDGMLLIATSAGMVSFDGRRFVPMQVDAQDVNAHEAVNALMMARNGDLWIGTDGRGIVVRHANGSTVSLSEKAGFPQDRLRMFYQDERGTVWAATQNGVERIQDGKFQLLKSAGLVAGDTTTTFAEDGHGGMFFITCRGLFWWRHGGAKPLPLAHPEMGSLLAVYRDPQKRLWVGMSHGVMQLVPHGDGFEQVPNRQVQGPVSVMAGDQDGNLWVGTRTHGLWRLSPDRSVSYWSTAAGLPNNSIRSMYVDDEQNLWIGMLNGGLARWRKAPLMAYGVPEGLPAEFAANVLRGPNGDLWLGTWGRGLFRLHRGRLYPEALSGMRTTQPIRALALDVHEKLWVGTWFDGLYRYDGARFHHYLLGTESPANAVSAVAGDRRGALWIGTYTGLIRFAGGVPQPGKADLLLQNRLITCLQEAADGSMLVGTASGLYRVRGEQTQAVTGLSQPYVLSISTDTFGNTWVGTKAGGLDLLAGDSVRHLDQTSGILDNPVSSMVEDGYGFMWMGTNRGILRVSARDLDDLAHGKRETIQSVLYGKSDGMRSSECGSSSQPTAALASDGSVWFATAKGFVHSNPETAYLQSPPPVVRLEGFRLDGAPTDEAKVLKLPAGLNDLVIHFNAKRLADPGQLVFRYRMEGYNTEWKETQDRSAHYGRLLPGRYKFQVEARNAGDAWIGTYAEVEINQQAFFYQTLWFRLLLLVPLCLLAIKLFRWRVARVKGELGVVLEERYRIARDWHDTLMAEFAAISWQLESTARLLRDDSVGGKHPAAVKSCELARSMVSHCQAEARRIIWDLRESDHATPMLSEALSRTLSATATQDRIDMQLRVIGKEVPLAQRYIHHLVCIGQEAVTNALRHAQPKTISIRLHYADSELNISVRDDGCGFSSSTSANVTLGHFGIPVMEERARKLGGSLRVETATGSGTEVLVSIPFLVPTLAAGAKA